MLPFFTMPAPIFFDSLNVTSTLTSSSQSKPYNVMFVYKEIQLILSRIEFSLLVRPSTTVPLSHVAPWGNELATPAIECVSAPNTTRSHSHLYCIFFQKWKSRQSYPFTPAVPVDVSSRCLGFFEFTIW